MSSSDRPTHAKSVDKIETSQDEGDWDLVREC